MRMSRIKRKNNDAEVEKQISFRMENFQYSHSISLIFTLDIYFVHCTENENVDGMGYANRAQIFFFSFIFFSLRSRRYWHPCIKCIMHHGMSNKRMFLLNSDIISLYISSTYIVHTRYNV